jgi:hypothetical protein
MQQKEEKKAKKIENNKKYSIIEMYLNPELVAK